MKSNRALFMEIKRLADLVTDCAIVKPVTITSETGLCDITCVYIPQKNITRIDIKHG